MGLSSFANKAKRAFEKRGGTDALKADAGELKDIATGGGSLADKAKRAADAVKEPGAKGQPAAESAAEPAADSTPKPSADSTPGPAEQS